MVRDSDKTLFHIRYRACYERLRGKKSAVAAKSECDRVEGVFPRRPCVDNDSADSCVPFAYHTASLNRLDASYQPIRMQTPCLSAPSLILPLAFVPSPLSSWSPLCFFDRRPANPGYGVRRLTARALSKSNMK